MTASKIRGVIDCHAHDFDGADDYYTLAEIREHYGIEIRDATGEDVDTALLDWATWYVVTGPRGAVIRFLAEEIFGDAYLALEVAEGWERLSA